MGSSNSIPDIGVRLSASGVQDVITAFQRVRAEGKQTGEETAAGIELINGALESLAELLPVISIGLAVEKLVDLSKEALETADSLGKLSEKTDIAVGTLSALSLAAKETDTNQESLDKGLVKLTKSMQDAATGSAKPKQAFHDLGISISDLNTKSPDQIFELVAKGLADIESPGIRAQAAINLFGRAGAELIPLLNQVAEVGLAGLTDKAKLFGVYIDGDFVESAKAAKAGLADVGAEVEGAALQFTAGLLPAVIGVTNALAQMAGGADGFRAWGQLVGAGILSLADGFALLDRDITVALANLTLFAERGKIGLGLDVGQTYGNSTIQQASQTAKQGNSSAIADAKNAINQANLDFAATAKTLDAAYAALYAAPKTTTTARPNAAAQGSGSTQAQQDKLAQAQSAYEQSLADNKLAIEKTTNQLLEQEDKRHYDAGLLTTDQYYDKVEARIKASATAELSSLQSKLDATSLLPTTTEEQQLKQLTEQGKIQTQITQTQLQENSQLAQAEDQRSKAKADANKKELEDTKTLQTAIGDKFGAEETGLTLDLQNYDQLLQKVGNLTEAEREAALAQFQTRGQGKIAFEQSSQSGSSALDTLNQGTTAIQNQATNGSISNVAAQAQILELQKDSLANLQAIGLQMFKNAVQSGDPTAIETANKFNASLLTIHQSLTNVTSASTELTNQLTGPGYTDLTTFFTEGISGAKSFGDAMTDLGNSFEQIVAKMVSQLLVYYALAAILGFVNDNTNIDLNSEVNNLQKNGPFSANPLTGHAGGGYTGDGGVHEVAGVVHKGEWVLDAPTTKANRPFLEALQRGETPSIVTPQQTAMSVADSYSQQAADSGSGLEISPPIINITNTTNQPVSQKQSKGSNGQSITDIIIGTIATDIAKGGKTAQTMQSTYGIARQGTRKS